jgi:hypothetical protein
MIEILLGISVLVSGFLIWYVVRLIKKFLHISEELENLFILLEDYAEHVDKVYNLERFYGDTTLEHLMRHSKLVAETSKNFRAMYDINYDLEEDEEYEDEEE